ncbi:dihydrolipoyl dehydrogenase family protein [Desulfosarcina ovata]|uniref:Mercuric reductase n=1 Tax=Desulfosarcina ovata subsp. ovata TaxID=2752305 RepID=A0A5K8AGI3_9BACT|nr:FAD-dependent oxidoreductase [Desulfosarcina ovata]BBO90960.1 mercuric reductase [Desulfosarcina ovata subsp. ovata]
MAVYDYDIGIIGGGAAGLTVASGAAQLGAKTLLVEKEPALGGDCLHYGCVPSKTLIHSARVWHQIKHADRFGLSVVDVPPVDFSRIARRIQDVIAVIQRHDSEERFCRLGAKVVFGSVFFRDAHTVDLNGSRVSAKTWVVATGSSPAVPPIPGLGAVDFLTNRQIFSLETRPGSMIILGAGPIGIEMAQAFNRLGTKVTVVGRSGQILSREDRDMADAVQARLAAEGVSFYLGASVQRVSPDGPRKCVRLQLDSGRKIDIRADALLVALGRRPNVEDLRLEAAGVAVEPAGIVVDPRLRTRQKHIFAAGDVNGGFQFTHAAGYEGGIVVSNAVFHLPRKVDYTWLPWCTYTDPELASIGMNERRARASGIDCTVLIESFGANDRALAEGETDGRIKLILDKKEKPLGVQILGPRAGDLIAEWVATLNGGTKLSSLASAVHPYPTLAEINKRVAGNLFSPKIFSETVQKGLKLFFNLKGRACTPSVGDGPAES